MHQALRTRARHGKGAAFWYRVAMRRPDMPFRHLGRQNWILLAILGVALWLRLVSIGFGLPALNDPDELMFEMGALRMLRGLTLNPGWFGHPATTTIYVLALTNTAMFAVAWLFGWAASARQFGELIYADPSWMILPGRIVMALFALATIYLTWRLARRFFGPATGLVAAALLAASPVHVTYSQIIRSDMMACLFMLLCLRSSIAIAERGNRRAYLTAALWLGLAVATKWPFALSGLAIGAATLVAVRTGVLDRRRAAVRLAAAGGAAIGFLFLASPYLLIDYATVLKNLHGEGQAHHLGATGGGFWQNLWWYARGPVLAGFGPGGIALFLVGALRLRRRRLAAAILVPVGTAFVLLLCTQHLVWERWALPLMPIGAIVAAAGLTGIAARLRRGGWIRTAPWAAAAMLGITLAPLGARVRSDGAMRMNNTRQMASAWARAHVPPGSTVLVEHFAFDIIAEPWRFLFPMGDAGCVDALAYLHGRISYATIERARAGRSNVDYGTVAPARRATCRADFVISTQFDRYAHERTRFPGEYAAYRSLAATGRVAAVFAPRPGQAGGPVVTILDLR